MAGYGVGATLASLGTTAKNDAMNSLGQVVGQEAQRESTNKQIDAQRKQGNQQLATTVGALGGFALGAQAGAVGGPMGALIGGAVGAIAGGLFD
jgi:outer membrane lipoprotein SlyB